MYDYNLQAPKVEVILLSGDAMMREREQFSFVIFVKD